MAALWMKKLCEINSQSTEDSSDKYHVEFLKLLLLVMQGNHLTGIFESPPPTTDLHELLPPSPNKKLKAKDMTSLIKSVKKSSLGEKVVVTCHPIVMTSIGCDMCEYVAVQEIPNFGIHGYYALSNEPLSKWSKPASYGPVEAKTSTACFKHTCELMADEDRPDEEEKIPAKKSDDTDAPCEPEVVKKKPEITKHSENSLQKIFQTQRSEIAGVETRPCWGRSRYIERLVDESPHVVGDLDLATADAILHHYRDTKYRKEKVTGGSKEKKPCVVSSRRREVEMRLNRAPCAPIIVEEEYRCEKASEKASRTCIPKDVDCVKFADDDDQEFMDPEYDYDAYDYLSDDQFEEADEAQGCDNWPDYVLEAKNMSGAMRSKGEAEWMMSDPESVRESRILTKDPERRSPPCHKLKPVQRRINPTSSDQINNLPENWNPKGHSTAIDH